MGIFARFRRNIGRGAEQYRATAGAVLLDVRTPQEYRNGHIHGSVNVPPAKHGVRRRRGRGQGDPALRLLPLRRAQPRGRAYTAPHGLCAGDGHRRHLRLFGQDRALKQGMNGGMFLWL